MATLENIRKRGPLVATVIGLALLAFIMGDFLNSGKSLFSGSRTEVAEIAGQSVNIQEYQNKIEELTNMYKNQYGGAFDATMTERVRSDVWEQLIQTYVMQKEYDATGVKVNSQEVMDMVSGSNISPMIRNLFTNPNTGAFNPQDVVNYLQNIKFDKTGAAKAQWLYIEKELINQRTYQKYQNLVAKGLFITDAQAKRELLSRAKTVTVNFIAQPFTSVGADIIKVTDSDIKAYYKSHQNEFKQENSRDIAYITLDVVPSAADQLKAEEDIKSYLSEFTSTDNNEQFVNANSDVPFDGSNYKKEDLSGAIAEFAFTQAVGSVYGPYFENGAFKIAKIDSRKTVPDSVRVRHILVALAQGGNKEAAKAKADSLKALITSGAAFAQVAMENSDDKGSALKGGDLDWFTEGKMVKEFTDACFNAKKGELSIVETQFGFHLYEVTDIGAGTEKVKLATLVHDVEPSTATYQGVYNMASQYATEIKTAEEFDKAIETKKLEKRVANNLKEMDFQISGLEQPRDLISWSFKGEKGDVSKVYELGNRFVIAVITDVKEKGIATLESVKSQIETIVTKEKQGEYIANQLKEAFAGANTINALAAKFKLEVQTADNLNFNAFSIAGAGNEPKLIGAISVLEKGKLSNPIIGLNAVYVAIVTEVNQGAVSENITVEQDRMKRSVAGRAGFQSFDALREAADIKDQRSKFF